MSSSTRPKALSTDHVDVGNDYHIQAFEVDIGAMRESSGFRLDASHYNATLVRAMKALQETGMTLKPLRDVTTKIFMPPRFRRIYVEQRYGLPFVQGSHLVHFQPADIKYISRRAHKNNIDRWVIERDWVLVTRSGTVGRVMLTPASWHGWAASEHILRIVPSASAECPPGYLYAFLKSSIGQAQLTSHIYGAVVDEITENHVQSIHIPIPTTNEELRCVQQINRMVMDSVVTKEKAKTLDEQSLGKMNDLLYEGREAQS